MNLEQFQWELAQSKNTRVLFDCEKYNKKEGQSCDLNNNCRFPNCTQGKTKIMDETKESRALLRAALYFINQVPNKKYAPTKNYKDSYELASTIQKFLEKTEKHD